MIVFCRERKKPFLEKAFLLTNKRFKGNLKLETTFNWDNDSFSIKITPRDTSLMGASINSAGSKSGYCCDHVYMVFIQELDAIMDVNETMVYSHRGLRLGIRTMFPLDKVETKCECKDVSKLLTSKEEVFEF